MERESYNKRQTNNKIIPINEINIDHFCVCMSVRIKKKNEIRLKN